MAPYQRHRVLPVGGHAGAQTHVQGEAGECAIPMANMVGHVPAERLRSLQLIIYPDIRTLLFVSVKKVDNLVNIT